ncbi:MULTISPECIES: HAMP domain-containing sensor histidine kinase [Bacteroidales]|jgi:two-component system phosphate regulon sensor histidine kinase PhoR|uniref:sensor histidine kinase n=1 Tax=uncultured Bacteroides sp. TaxID=162156 RepID=UPI00259A7531|nr:MULTISPECIES: HAMP domain-containing sensor histidine kinase [Bacteroidales]
MEKRIKTLYIVTIAAIMAFLGMQMYWLYGRYEFSLREYEHHTEAVIADVIVEYNKERDKKGTGDINTSYSMSHGVDSAGNTSRKVTVSSSFNGRKLLGIDEERNLTDEEKERLAEIVSDSLQRIEEKKLSIDASTAPSDGAAWAAMRNFELEVQSPFTIQGLDSLLKKENINAVLSLTTTDSIMWKSAMYGHKSFVYPHFQIISPYSELERKAVIIDCTIPTADIVREMGWTLVLAFVLSILLILCLIWQIKTIIRLSRLDNMRNSFITTMIHELKRPISTLKMCVSGLDNKQMVDDPEIRKELLSETRTALDNLSAYFSKLRDITFNNVEQIPLNIQSVNLHDLFDTVAAATIRPSGKDVVVHNEIASDIVVSADRSHFYNILNNLVENAVKYSGDSVEIKASANADKGEVVLSISDNGNGIPSGDLKHIFQRFFRGKASVGEQPGMGLGLAYVKLLVEAHGGEISAESTLGQGTCFTIKLPQ